MRTLTMKAAMLAWLAAFGGCAPDYTAHDAGQDAEQDAGQDPGSDGGHDGGGDGCVPETREELCADVGASCGEIIEIDRCGVTRTTSCGTCTPPDVCGGGGLPGACGHGECVPTSDSELCDDRGFDCGEASIADNCGVTRAVDCGTCSAGTTCGGAGVDNVCGVPGPCVPSTTVPSGWSYLDNGIAKVGVNLRHGAAIGHFSAGGDNVLDSNDTGRYLQQSYYGDERGGSWHGEPWPFNPVQGGSADGDRSPVVEFCNNGDNLYAKTLPLDWGGTGSTPSVMEEWIHLEGDVAVIRFRFEYTGDWTNESRHQEVPALFVTRELEHLARYEGGAPWSGAAVTRVLPNQLMTAGNQYVSFDESWLALVDGSDWGVGLYERGASFATCYRYLSIGDRGATSYFAFVDSFALTPGLVHDYTLYAKIGTLTELRSAFRDFHDRGL